MSVSRRRLGRLGLAAAVLLGFAAGVRYGPGSGPGLHLLAELVSGSRVGDVGWLRLSDLRGDPWSDLTIGRLEIVDRKGVWLSARDIAIRWDAAALLARRVRITEVAARTITLLRDPVLMASRPPSPSDLAIEVRKISTRLTITPAFASRRGDYLVDGAIDVERDDRISGRLRALSLTFPGDFLRTGFSFGPRAVNLEAHAREARGGAIAGSLGLDATSPFLLDAAAHGDPHAGSFAIAASVGSTTPAQATGRWRPTGGEASGHLDLGASRFLAPWRQGIGPDVGVHMIATRLAGGLYRMRLAATGARATFTADGDVDLARRRTAPRGLSLNFDAADLSAFGGVRGLGGGKASGVFTGDDRLWSLAGVAAIERIRAAGEDIARVEGPFRLRTTDRGLEGHFEVGASGVGQGTWVGRLLGAAPRASADVQWLGGGRVLLERLMVKGAAFQISGQGERGLFGDLAFKGQARVAAAALAPARGVGEVLADWRAEQPRESSPWRFAVKARGVGMSIGTERDETLADRLLGPRPELVAEGRLDQTGVALDRVNLRGLGASANIAGRVTAVGDLSLRLDGAAAGPLRLGPMSVSALRGAGSVSGSLDRPRLDVAADAALVDAPGSPQLTLRNPHLTLLVAGVERGFTGRLAVDGRSGGGPAHASAEFASADGAVALSRIDVNGEGVALTGSGVLRGDSLSQADIHATVGPGALLTRGHAQGRLQVSGDGERTRLEVDAANVVLAQGSALQTLRLTAQGPLDRLEYQLQAVGEANGMEGRLAGNGVVAASQGARTLSFLGAGRAGPADFKTLAPATVAFRSGEARGDLHLAIGGGRADVTLTSAQGALKARAVLAAMDLALLDPDIRGRADGVLNVSRIGGALVGDADATVSGVTGRDDPDAAPMGGSLAATFAGQSVAIRTELRDAKGARIKADLQLPATLTAEPFRLALDTRRPVSGRFSADGEIGPVWDLLEGGGRTMTGRLIADGAIGGTLADPRFTGTAAITHGDFEDAGVGLGLKGLTLRADLKGEAIDVTAFNATDGAKGSIAGSGQLSLQRDAASGFRLTLKDFRLIDTTLIQASASGGVDVDRAADGHVRLGGVLTITRAQISPMASTPSGVVPMDVEEINGPGDTVHRIAATAAREPPISLNIALKAPGGLFIKGRGLNMELSLDAKVTGSSASPALSGVARVVRGDYDFAGKRFKIDDGGAVYLGSTADSVRLDVTATRDDPTLTAVIKIQGTAAAPTLTLTSTPPLPKDEVLSQVLFGASASQLSGLQAAQLASAVAGLAKGGGFDVIGGLRGLAHLDRLAIDSGATTGFTVAGGKYISDKVYVELQGGARIGQGAQVEWRVRKHVAIVSRVTSQGDNAVSVRWRKDY